MGILRDWTAYMLGTLLLAVSSASAADTADRFVKLRDELKAGNVNIDYMALRDAYAGSAEYDPYGTKLMLQQKELSEKYRVKDCVASLDAADKVLAINYLHLNAHIVKLLCSVKLRKEDQANFHKEVVTGLLKALTKGKDGKTPASAFSVVMIDEEYALLAFYRLERTGQQLLSEGGKAFDRLDFVDPNGREGTLFFNIDRPMAWLNSKGLKGPPQTGVR